MNNVDLPKRDPVYDGIRGLAAFWVFTTHSAYWGFSPKNIGLEGSGRGAVILFLFLSAFLITLRHGNNGANLSIKVWTKYFIKRLVRISPAYFSALLILYFFKMPPFDTNDAVTVLFEHFTYQKGLHIFWTIVVEMRFYLLFPLLYLSFAIPIKLLKIQPHYMVFAFLGVTSLMAVHVLPTKILGLSHAPIFIAGIAAALIVTQIKSLQSAGVHLHARLAFTKYINQNSLDACAFVFALAFILSSLPGATFFSPASLVVSEDTVSNAYQPFWEERISWIGILLIPLFVCLSVEARRLRAALSWKVLSWLGEISFGFYLTHTFALQLVSALNAPWLLSYFIALLLSISLGSILHYFIENPTISWVNKTLH